MSPTVDQIYIENKKRKEKNDVTNLDFLATNKN